MEARSNTQTPWPFGQVRYRKSRGSDLGRAGCDVPGEIPKCSTCNSLAPNKYVVLKLRQQVGPLPPSGVLSEIPCVACHEQYLNAGVVPDAIKGPVG